MLSGSASVSTYGLLPIFTTPDPSQVWQGALPDPLQTTHPLSGIPLWMQEHRSNDLLFCPLHFGHTCVLIVLFLITTILFH